VSKQDTGSVFLNRAQSNVDDAKLVGVQFTGNFNGVQVTAAKAADDTLTLKIDGDYKMLKPQFNKYGCYWIEEINGQRYFLSPRTNDRGAYVLAKVAKPREGGDTAAPAAPKTYGKRT
jgi:hypothetical protein